jgi:hypothetical protein
MPDAGLSHKPPRLPIIADTPSPRSPSGDLD